VEETCTRVCDRLPSVYSYICIIFRVTVPCALFLLCEVLIVGCLFSRWRNARVLVVMCTRALLTFSFVLPHPPTHS
jgi:hypothetical protein